MPGPDPNTPRKKAKEPLTPDEVTVLFFVRSAVEGLLLATAKGGHLYAADPQRVPDLNRSGKRLLATIEALLASQKTPDV